MSAPSRSAVRSTLLVDAALRHPQHIFHSTALALQRDFVLQYDHPPAALPLTIHCGGTRTIGFILTHEECSVPQLRGAVAQARSRVERVVVIILIDLAPMKEWKCKRRCGIAAEDDIAEIDSVGWTIFHAQYERLRDIAMEDDWQSYLPVYNTQDAADAVKHFSVQFATTETDRLTINRTAPTHIEQVRARLAAIAPLNGREQDISQLVDVYGDYDSAVAAMATLGRLHDETTIDTQVCTQLYHLHHQQEQQHNITPHSLMQDDSYSQDMIVDDNDEPFQQQPTVTSAIAPFPYDQVDSDIDAWTDTRSFSLAMPSQTQQHPEYDKYYD